MKFCANYKPGAKRPERAPVAVPAGLLTMGLLVMTFESTMAVLLGLLLGAWGATALFLRGTELACCIKCRKEKLARGEEAPSCLPV
jgi:hypothetical protein